MCRNNYWAKGSLDLFVFYANLRLDFCQVKIIYVSKAPSVAAVLRQRITVNCYRFTYLIFCLQMQHRDFDAVHRLP